ncbi:capsule assembly Wzi family protein [Echinicola jeungdonensis]|uniref:Capsule assembly Wzi family protein n=1 Tax=Echinicola jeungdonensis TaxID=709343 RepID=A0ABV5J6S8_9BACT|nr:capsule assembly Wzi family protein [Echinicola jeungdonensis]MDN3669232.1 capsule assembly Wzi family protein [Echinicola jeungdonensis]
MNKIIPLFFMLVLPSLSSAQSISLNNFFLEDYLRRQQLMGNFEKEYSFNLRPISPRIEDFWDQSKATFEKLEMLLGKGREFDIRGEKINFRYLPVTFKTQYNSNYAFGINDGAMIPNRGLQALVSGGIYAEWKGVSLQFQPELVTAQNLEYEGFPSEHNGRTWKEYYEWLNTHDNPERFGTEGYIKLLPGQSSIRYNAYQMSVGISTENIWWGPGKRNSLLMSNNAPGFLHFTLNTQKPISTSIGQFEGQLIAAKLKNSDYLPPRDAMIHQNTPLRFPKRDDWRYLSGITVSYQPKWVPGLSVGYSSVSQMYHNDMNKLKDYLPLFNGEKGPANVVDLERDSRNQLSSGYFRWMSHGGLFEFYGEYGSNGNSRELRDFLVNPDLNRAFTFGFSNLIPLKREDAFIQISSEMTQTGQTVRDNIVAHNSWYTHPYVRQGYTHKGQVMGAGNGPGSNVIFLEASWVQNFKKIGLQMERIVYNNDFYYKRFEKNKDWRRKYIDLVPSLVVDWQFNKVLFSSRLQYVNTLNYKWYLENSPDPDQYFVAGYDRKNIVANFSLYYFIR